MRSVFRSPLVFLCCPFFEQQFIVQLCESRHSRPAASRRRYFISFTPFLPATVFFGPLRVRALVRVR